MHIYTIYICIYIIYIYIHTYTQYIYTPTIYIRTFNFKVWKVENTFLSLFAASNTVNAVNSVFGCCSDYMTCYVFHCPLVVVSS